ncbi:mycothiol transferase [soil metagenome]
MSDDATRALLLDSFGRIGDLVHEVLGGVEPPALTHRVDPEANTIAWLMWHVARVQDDHIAGLAHTDQAWMAEGWAERFDLAVDPGDIGYGHSTAEVATLDGADPHDLLNYHDAVAARTLTYVEGIDDGELARVVDGSWDPPVTASIRLVSVIGDCLQHLGQAAYLRGVAERAASA